MAAILKLPIAARPRERLLMQGAEALSQQELLAILIRTGTKGESALQIASALLAQYGGLEGIATARPEELARFHGMGAAKAATLVAAFSLARQAEGSESRPQLRNPQDAADIAMRELAGLRRERVIVLICNAANRLLAIEKVAEGAIDRSPFPVREILNAVIRRDGRMFAVAHNHPSGDSTPSENDYRATDVIKNAASEVGLRFLGHLVIGDNTWANVHRAAHTRQRKN